MPAVSHNNIARAIYLALKDKGHAEQTSTNKKVARFLSQRRLLSKAPEILSQLEKIKNREEGVVQATIWSAEKLSREDRTRIEHFLKKHHKAKAVALREKVDAKIIGGVKIETDNEVMDFSIRNRINKLKEHLTKGA